MAQVTLGGRIKRLTQPWPAFVRPRGERGQSKPRDEGQCPECQALAVLAPFSPPTVLAYRRQAVPASTQRNSRPAMYSLVQPCTLSSHVLCNHRQDRQDRQDFPLALALLPRLLRKCKGSSRPRRLQDRRFFLPNIYLVLLPVCKLCQDAIQRWFFIVARFASVSLRPPPQGQPGTCLKPSAPPRLRLSLCHSTAPRPNRYSAPSPCLPRSRNSSSRRRSSHSSRRRHQRRPATPSRQLRPRVLLPTPPRAALPPPILPMRTSSAAGMPATKSLAPQSCSM